MTFLYYERSVEPMMSMSINDLASIQTNSTEDTENKIIHFLMTVTLIHIQK